MDKATVAGGAMAVVGGLVALQAPINATLGRAVGSLPAVWMSFAIGLVALTGLTLLVGGGFGDLGEARGLPWWAFIGGLVGAIYVATALVAVKSLGAAGITAATIAGQLTLSVVADRLGWFGLEERDLNLWRIVGVLLLAVGTFLVIRD